MDSWFLRWRNFRGYEVGPLLEFPALTVLIGRNNVGKTSTYAPLLLLKQTLAAKREETALLFRGALVDFGSYSDVITDHDVTRRLGLELDFGPAPKRSTLSRGEDSQALVPQKLSLEFDHVDGQTRVSESAVLDRTGKAIIRRRLADDGQYAVASPLIVKNKDVGRPIREVTALRKSLLAEQPHGFLFSGIGGILLPSDWRTDEDRWSKVRRWYSGTSAMFDIYERLNAGIKSALSQVSYLGPIRSSPQRSYLLSAELPPDVGKDGEFATEILYRQTETGDKNGLVEETNVWLEKLGYGGLSFENQGEYFRSFATRDGSSVRVNIADCGMGLAQLLPILVQGLSTDPGGTLVVQQPEIHLNPAQQDVMTDFLVHLSVSGRRIILETHSEHVLTRLRRRMAESDDIGSRSLALYFCDSENDRSIARRIPVSDFGEISAEDWPRGFFSEQVVNSMEMALAQSRRR